MAELSCVWAIQQGRYDSAEKILAYSSKLQLSKPTYQLMVAINYAQTKKWQRDGAECERILAEQDWDAANATFRLCAAVLREDDDVEKLLIGAVSESICLSTGFINDLCFGSLEQARSDSVIEKRRTQVVSSTR